MTTGLPRSPAPSVETLFLVRATAAAIRQVHLPVGAEQCLMEALRHACQGTALSVEDLLEIAFDLACDRTVRLEDVGALWSR